MQRVLLTGGLGYLGSRLAQHLARATRVQVLLGTRRRPHRLDWLPEAAVVEMDWQSERALRAACHDTEAVVHLAGMNSAQCAADPVAALEFNAVATTRLVRAAAAVGVRRFLYVSTAHVYGRPLRGVMTESTLPTNLHPYATSHRAAEESVRFMQEKRALEGVVVRLSNSFGVPAHRGVNCWKLLVNDLCRQAVEHGELVLNSSGLQRRDFITLTDVSRAVQHLLQLEPGAIGDGLFNLGGAWAPTVMEMAERIARCWGLLCGRRPQISRPVPSPGELSTPLEFRIDKLLQTGFDLRGDADAEITATLQHCLALSQASAT
jgi:UDP-glucose 4-epimerase